MSTASPMSASSHRLPASVLAVVPHALLWAAWLLGLLLWVPRVERVLRNINIKLPSSTAFVVALTHGVVPLGVLLALVFIVLDSTVYYRLRRPSIRALWSRLMTVAPLAAIILTAVAVSYPMLLVLEGITK